MRWPLAEISLPLADRAYTLAAPKHRRRGEGGGLRYALERMHRSAGQAVRYGGRRLGVVVYRRGESIVARRE